MNTENPPIAPSPLNMKNGYLKMIQKLRIKSITIIGLGLGLLLRGSYMC